MLKFFEKGIQSHLYRKRRGYTSVYPVRVSGPFAAIGALRGESDEEITSRFLCTYAEDADLAMKILFFARDVRGVSSRSEGIGCPRWFFGTWQAGTGSNP